MHPTDPVWPNRRHKGTNQQTHLCDCLLDVFAQLRLAEPQPLELCADALASGVQLSQGLVLGRGLALLLSLGPHVLLSQVRKLLLPLRNLCACGIRNMVRDVSRGRRENVRAVRLLRLRNLCACSVVT